MKHSESEIEFQNFAARNGVDLAQSTPLQGLSQMMDFYHQVEAEGCQDSEHDMLLYEWGTYVWDGDIFGLGFVRQFIATDPSGGEAVVMSQLSLKYRFAPHPDFKALASGNRWMDDPSRFAEWRDFVLSSPAFLAVADRRDAEVELLYYEI